VGELDPRYLRAYDVRAEHVPFALIDLEEVKRPAELTVIVDQPARLPAVERDLAVVVKESVAQARVAATIRRAAGASLTRLTLFDRYQGRPLADDELSLAYRLRFQPSDKPLADADLEDLMKRVTADLETQLAARIRGSDERL
jgi:phenylalanyl-tRNA synthetase beta chain